MAASFSGPKLININPPMWRINHSGHPYPPDFIRRTILWLKSKVDDLRRSILAGLPKRPETFHQENRLWDMSESTSFQARKTKPSQLDDFNWPILFISCPPYQLMETLL